MLRHLHLSRKDRVPESEHPDRGCSVLPAEAAGYGIEEVQPASLVLPWRTALRAREADVGGRGRPRDIVGDLHERLRVEAAQ